MRRLLLVILVSSVAPAGRDVRAAADPFAFFSPSVVTSADEQRRLEGGGTLARVVPGQKHAIAVFSATPLDVGGDRLVAWMRHIAALKKSTYVEQIGRFSNPPRLEDLDALTLDPADIADLRQCRLGRCGLKLARPEIEMFQRTLQSAGADVPGALQTAFRQLVLARVQAYAASGHTALGDYSDRGSPVSLQATFSELVQQSVFLRRQLPDFADYLERWPQAPLPRVESFFYWSKERFGAKPVVSVTQVSILRGDGQAAPDAVAVGKQVFATHYMDGSLSVTAIVGGADSRRYLAYLNRSDVDVIGGFWGGLIRRILERRLKSEAPAILQALRQRLESGDPPE
jgi:hypothetical protein